jgi:hypothetical protein
MNAVPAEYGVIYLVTFTPFWRRVTGWTGWLNSWASRQANKTAIYSKLRYDGNGSVSVNK